MYDRFRRGGLLDVGRFSRVDQLPAYSKRRRNALLGCAVDVPGFAQRLRCLTRSEFDGLLYVLPEH